MATSGEFKELETAFTRARGVQGVRVSRDKKGAMKLNVIATGERTPKQIVRDLKAIAQVDFSTELDHRFISIAEPRGQGDLEEDSLRKFRRNKRILINGVTNESGTVTVTLSKGSAEQAAQAPAKDDPDSAVATCTIEALQALEPAFTKISLGSAVTVDTGEYKTALVTVSIAGDTGEHQVAAGCAVIRDAGELTAVARAVLDAVNRRIAQEK